MRKLFRADMEAMGDSLSEISGLVSQAMERAREAIITSDIQLAQTIVSDDARIDFLQASIDEKAIELLLLQAPVATDLRTLVAALRMSASMERMGDLARHIAQLTRLRYPEPVIPESRQKAFQLMLDNCVNTAHELEQLMADHDLEHTNRIFEFNSVINRLHAENFKAIAEPGWDSSPAQTADVTLASRYLERFADHAVSIARKITYLVTGDWQPKAPGI